MSNIRNDIVTFFQERHIKLRDEWLDEVYKFLKERNLKLSSTNVLSSYIYEQWLYSDISESMEPSTSNVDLNARLSSLKNPIILQIKYVLDISDSYYGQVKVNKKGFVDNSGFEALTENEKETFREAKPQRTLSLLLTNGVNDFMAIEHKPIRDISVATIPGTKVLFIPPMKIRHGKFFLNSGNLQVLGGDVETYVKKYNPIQVMADHLKMKLNTSPKKTDAPPVAAVHPPVQINVPAPIPTQITSHFPTAPRSTGPTVSRISRMSDPHPPAATAPQRNDYSRGDSNNIVIEEDDSDDEISMRSKSRRNILNRVIDISRSDEDVSFLPSTSTNTKSNNSSLFDNNTTWGLNTQFDNNILQESTTLLNSPGQNRTPERAPEDNISKTSLKRKSDHGNQRRSNVESPLFMPNIFQEEDPDFRISSFDKDRPLSLLERALQDEFEKSKTSTITPRKETSTAARAPPTLSRNPFSTPTTTNPSITQPASRFNELTNNTPSTQIPAHKRSRISEPEITNFASMSVSKKPEPQRAKSIGGLHKFFEPAPAPKTQVTSSNQSATKAVKMEIIELSDDEVDIKPVITPAPMRSRTSSVQVKPLAKSVAPSIVSTPSVKMNFANNAIIDKYLSMNIISIGEAVRKSRFILGGRKYNIQAFVQNITQPLRIVEGLWTMQINLRDSSSNTLLCFVDDQTITKMIGWPAEEARRIQNSMDKGLKMEGDRRLKFAAKEMLRLDLLMEIELFGGGLSTPIVRKIMSLAQLQEGMSQ